MLIIEHFDLLRKPLAVNDTVVFPETYNVGGWSPKTSLNKGKIITLTPKRVRIEYYTTRGKTKTTSLKEPHMVAKVKTDE
jgi:hypothetical protein